MCQNSLTEAKYHELEQFINCLSHKQSSLITVLHKAQNLFGYLPQEVQLFVADKLNIPASKVYGVVTFYSYFTTEPRGKYVINVCLGTACFIRGSGSILEEFEKQLNIRAGQTTPDGKFTIDVLRCVGACGLAPVAMINGKVYGHLSTSEVKKILDQYRD